MDEREIKIIATADTRKAVENLNLFSERVQTIRKNLKRMGETAVKAGKDAERSMEKISQSAEKGLSAEEKRKASRGFGDAGKQGREKISEIFKKLPKKYKRIFKNKGIMNEEGKGIGGDLFKNMTSGVLASLTAGRVLASRTQFIFSEAQNRRARASGVNVDKISKRMKQDIEKFKEIVTFEEQFDFAETVLPKAFNQERQEEIIEGIRNQFQALPQEFQPATEAVDAFDLSLEGVIEETEILGDQTSGLQGNIVKLASAMSDSLPDWEANTLAYQSAGESLGFIGEQAEESGEFLDLFAESDAPQEFSNNWSRGLTAFVSSSQSATRSATSAFQNFASQSRNAISNSLFSLLQGDMKNFGNIWKNFAGSLLDTFTNTFTKLASNSIFSLFGLGGGGGLGDLFGGGGIAKQFVLGGGGSGGGGVKTLTLPV